MHQECVPSFVLLCGCSSHAVCDVGIGGCVPTIGCIVVATGGMEKEGVCNETVPEKA